MEKTEDILYIKGLKGIACMLVVCHHLWLVFGVKIIQYINNGEVTLLMHGFFANIGRLMVYIFFLTTGFVMAHIARSGTFRVMKSCFNRYFKLMVPVAVVSCISYCFMKNHLYAHAEFSLLGFGSWAEGHNQFAPSFVGMLKDSVWNTWKLNGNSNSYVTFLWCMSYELWGGILVGGLQCLFSGENDENSFLRKKKFLFSIFLIIFLNQSYYSLFVVGSVLYELYLILCFDNSFCVKDIFAWIFVGIGITIACYGNRIPYISAIQEDRLVQIGAVLSLCGCMAGQGIKKILEFKWSIYLGKISYSVYLVHYIILFSFTCGGYRFLTENGLGHIKAILLCYLLTFLVVVIVATVFDKNVNWLSKFIVKKIDQIFLTIC